MLGLLQVNESRPGHLHRAIQVLQDVKFQHGCRHQAAASVINSCRTLESTSASDHPSFDIPDTLEHLMNIHAIEMTYCELATSDIKIPHVCNIFCPSSVHKQASRWSLPFRSHISAPRPSTGNELAEQFTPDEVASCKHALHEVSSSWSTFIGYKMQTMDLCQASHEATNLSMLLSTSLPIRHSQNSTEEKFAVFENLTHTAIHLQHGSEATLATVRAVAEGIEMFKAKLESLTSHLDDAFNTASSSAKDMAKSFADYFHATADAGAIAIANLTQDGLFDIGRLRSVRSTSTQR
jgi:hypothetical protein